MVHETGTYLRFLLCKADDSLWLPLDGALIHRTLAPSKCWYPFTYPGRMESWVSLGGIKFHTNTQISVEPGSNWGPCSRKAAVLQLRQSRSGRDKHQSKLSWFDDRIRKCTRGSSIFNWESHNVKIPKQNKHFLRFLIFILEVQSASDIRTFTKAANERSIESEIEKPKNKLSFKKFPLETPVTRQNNTF